jgi:shikimate 5-dehydrogenase
MDATDRKCLYLVGVSVRASIAPSMHNHIAWALGLSWEFMCQECPQQKMLCDYYGF